MEVSQNSNKPANNIRDYIDSEEIDFGTEPPTQQINVGEPTNELVVREEDFASEDLNEVPESEPIADDNIEEPEETPIEEPEETPIEEPEELADSEVNQEQPADSKSSRKESSEQRLTQLPLSKIKSIMKADPDVHIVAAEAIFLMTRAAELFVQNMAKEAHTYAVAGKKKTIVRRDVDMTIESVDTLMFLEGMMNV
ncbi:AAEL010085-PA [Aedes aegypti]|uniref:AAEL010085-PA n=1 Tax=Aedes aegypti TaxID=7159 RepID=Q16TX9_AEDAE|nr:AAEL010085-PA [Aedes aegypti]